MSADADALQRAAGGPTSVADFYCHPGARRLYAEHIRRVTGRVNTFTGRRYRWAHGVGGVVWVGGVAWVGGVV